MQPVEYGIVGAVVLFLLGLLGFGLRHVLTKTIPDMQASHAEQVKRMQVVQAAATLAAEKATVATVASMEASHTSICLKLIDTFKEEQREQRTLFREQAASERTVCERRHAENVAVLTALTSEFAASAKETRHALKELAHEMAMERTVVEHVTGVKAVKEKTKEDEGS